MNLGQTIVDCGAVGSLDEDAYEDEDELDQYAGHVAIQAHFSDEDHERQAALTRSWEAALRDLADAEVRVRIDAKLAELEARPPRPMTGDEFLASVGAEPRTV